MKLPNHQVWIYKHKYAKHNIKSIKNFISQAFTVEFLSKLILILRILFPFLSSLKHVSRLTKRKALIGEDAIQTFI